MTLTAHQKLRMLSSHEVVFEGVHAFVAGNVFLNLKDARTGHEWTVSVGPLSSSDDRDFADKIARGFQKEIVEALKLGIEKTDQMLSWKYDEILREELEACHQETMKALEDLIQEFAK